MPHARFSLESPPVPARTRRHRVPLLVRRFRLPDHPFSVGRLSLYGDRLDLRWLTLLGRRRRSIALEAITEMDYHPLSETGNLSIQLVSGERLHLHVTDAHLLREAFENWLRYNVLPSAKLMGDGGMAAAVAG